jgi:dTDP-4-amino-4,6-dideoxygalactose transaminase
LKEWAESHDVRLPSIPPYCDQTYHMFYMLLPNLELRQKFIQHLRERGIAAVFHYLPLHLSDMGRRFGGKLGNCPVTEKVSDQLVRLPFHNGLSEADAGKVVEAVEEFKFT